MLLYVLPETDDHATHTDLTLSRRREKTCFCTQSNWQVLDSLDAKALLCIDALRTLRAQGYFFLAAHIVLMTGLSA